jgi:predicted nuclease of predicted toxin-antitoxin system
VRFLVDANVSPRVAVLLAGAGHDAVAVRDVGLASAPDDKILDRALADDRVIVSHDTDFGTLLAARRLARPSFVLIRSSDPLAAEDVAVLILDNLDTIAEDLASGAIVTFARGRLRSRRLPLS